jgi:hypothetical protein
MKSFTLTFFLVFTLLLTNDSTLIGASTNTKYKTTNHDSCQSGYKEITLYGDRKVVGATHHTLVILRSNCDTYRLLEVSKIGMYIDIRSVIESSPSEALKRKGNTALAQQWGDVEHVSCSYQTVQNVISKYQGSFYDLIGNNCRCFVNSLHQACGSNKRTTSGSTGQSLFECGSDGKNGCCNIFHTRCCCQYADGSEHSYHSWGKHRKCKFTNHCNIGWKC